MTLVPFRGFRRTPSIVQMGANGPEIAKGEIRLFTSLRLLTRLFGADNFRDGSA